MRCDRCTFTKFVKIGKVTDPQGNKLRLWKCGRCSNQQTDPPPFIRQLPRELYFDIETSPNMAYLWSRHVPSTYVSEEMIVKDWFVISWAASWMDESEIHSQCVSVRDAKQWSDKRILKPLWELLDQADIVIGHNARKFDIRKVNTRFELHNMGVPRTYRILDTLSLAKKYFSFESNRMSFLLDRMGLSSKHEMDLSDWIACLKGDIKILDKMKRYNINDVRQGKKIYARIREWIHPFPKQPRNGYKVT